jgi:uncharacterized protein YegP (UPF0339 family)
MAMATANTSAPRKQRSPSTADAQAFWTATAMTFEAYEENSGRHRWQLLAPDGGALATSAASYASHADADRAAGAVRDGAGPSER